MATAVGSLRVRKYQPGDEEEINRLFNLVFQKNRSLEEWRWKFVGNPVKFPPEIAISIADLEGKVVGQYASVVVSFKVGDKVTLAAQPVDNLISPHLRGGGRIQLKLFAAQNALAQEGEVALGFGFPNEIAYSVGKRLLKYQDLCRLPILFRRLNWRNSVRRRIPRLPEWTLDLVDRISAGVYRVCLGRRTAHGVFVQEVPTFDGEIDALWESAKDGYGILAVRDAQYLRWRYLEKPFDRYTILAGKRGGTLAGYVVLKVKQEGAIAVGLIVDFFSVKDAAAEDALVRGALRWFLGKRVDYVLCWMLRENRVYRAMTRYGFCEHPAFPAVPVVYFLFFENLDEGFLKNPDNWYLTWGDSDGV